MIEAEENCSEIGFGPFDGIWLELRLDGDDKGGADRREQASLRMWSVIRGDEGTQKRTKIKVVLRSSLYLFMHSTSYSIVSRLYMV